MNDEENRLLYKRISDDYERVSIIAHKLSKEKNIDFDSAMSFVLHNNLSGVVESIDSGVDGVIEEVRYSCT